jgi:hypothetical protein
MSRANVRDEEPIGLPPPPAQLPLPMPRRRSPRATAGDVRARREVLRVNRGRVLTEADVREEIARKAER